MWLQCFNPLFCMWTNLLWVRKSLEAVRAVLHPPTNLIRQGVILQRVLACSEYPQVTQYLWHNLCVKSDANFWVSAPKYIITSLHKVRWEHFHVHTYCCHGNTGIQTIYLSVAMVTDSDPTCCHDDGKDCKAPGVLGGVVHRLCVDPGEGRSKRM